MYLAEQDSPTMPRVLLVITVAGRKVVTDHHPNEVSARQTLAAFVRSQKHASGIPLPISDEEAVEAYFSNRDASYTIGMIRTVSRSPGD